MWDVKEIAWPRVALAAAAIILFLVISGIAVSSAIGHLHPEPIGNESFSTVLIEEFTPEPLPRNTPAGLVDAMENTSAIPMETVLLYSTSGPIQEFNESAPGLRNTLQNFTIHRENVSGNKDLTIKTTVYGWKQFTRVAWRNDHAGKYFDQYAPDGEKYVFVFLSEYVEGNTPEQDSRAWYFGPNQFRLQIDGRLYNQDPDFAPEVRIQDLEDIKGFNGIKGLHPFGFLIIQDRGSGHISAEPDPWLRMGKSNAKDGYLVYRVPVNATDMVLAGSFGSWGNAAWILK